MTIVEFRSNPALTTRLSELLSDSTMQTALAVLRDSNPAIDPDPSADALASVRMLSQMVGYQTYPLALASMGQPLPAQSDIQPTYKPEN